MQLASDEARVYVVLQNKESRPVKIVGAFSPAAERVELRHGGAPVGAFAIPGNGTLRLAPGGDDILLTGLTRKLSPGGLVPVILKLDDGDTFAVMARIQ